MKKIEGNVCAAKGFLASGIACGLKKVKKDVALIYSETPCTFAGVFTQNTVAAAPVVHDRAVVKNSKYVNAIIINSGNANAATGDQGLKDCEETALYTAKALSQLNDELMGTNILVCSTGVIGVPLPIAILKKGIDLSITELAHSSKAADDAATAILTTDKTKKEIAYSVDIDGTTVNIGGIAKGSGMIHPNMATMLSFITTDANIDKSTLQKLLGSSIKDSYNMISVDGDTSTNDTVLVLANGESNCKKIVEGTNEYKAFKEVFDIVHTYLAKEIVKDGEGAGTFIEMVVEGAKSKDDAKKLARSVIKSSLVKAAFFGADANFGRILCAMGYSGAYFNLEGLDLSFSSKIGQIKVISKGTPIPFDEILAKQILLEKEVFVLAALEDGIYSATAWGCDLSYEYVRINGDYRS
ncbi:MAG: bifunctional glutamate N-acetyltransferase/amino-acid acetyltransferase ArgJ [Spirochaetaceae bacterium]|nr:bifunctional glutamate N-acetyltransferase/amino-acid acetyltransferase ArgJ [Spirochaetaceae bacterium]